jgi:ribosomal protein L37AE/L43A
MAKRTVTCPSCGNDYDYRRRQLGYNYCLDCGDFQARLETSKFCIAPIGHKQGDTLVTRKSDLLGLNKYMGEL